MWPGDVIGINGCRARERHNAIHNRSLAVYGGGEFVVAAEKLC